MRRKDLEEGSLFMCVCVCECVCVCVADEVRSFGLAKYFIPLTRMLNADRCN